MLGEDKGIDAVPHNFIRIMAGPAGLSIHPLFSGYSFQGKNTLISREGQGFKIERCKAKYLII